MLILLLNILFFSFVLFTINGKLCIRFGFFDIVRNKVLLSGHIILISFIIGIISLFALSGSLAKMVPMHNMINAITIIAIACIAGMADDLKRINFKLRKHLQHLIALLIGLNSFAFIEGEFIFTILIALASFWIATFLLNSFYATKDADNVNTTTSLILLTSFMQLAHLAGIPVVTILSFIMLPVFIAAMFYDRVPAKMNYGASGAYVIAALFSILFSYFADIELKEAIIPALALLPLLSDNSIIAIENRIKKGSFFVSERKNLHSLMWNKTGNIFSLVNYYILFVVCFLSGLATVHTGIYLFTYITAIIIPPVIYVLRKRYSID